MTDPPNPEPTTIASKCVMPLKPNRYSRVRPPVVDRGKVSRSSATTARSANSAARARSSWRYGPPSRRSSSGEDADRLALADQRRDEHRVRHVAGLRGDLRGEARVGAALGDGDALAARHHRAGEPGARRQPHARRPRRRRRPRPPRRRARRVAGSIERDRARRRPRTCRPRCARSPRSRAGAPARGRGSGPATGRRARVIGTPIASANASAEEIRISGSISRPPASASRSSGGSSGATFSIFSMSP